MQEMSKNPNNIYSSTSPGRVKSDSDLWLLISCLVTLATENGTDTALGGKGVGGLLDTHMEKLPRTHGSGVQGDLNLEVAQPGSSRKQFSPPWFNPRHSLPDCLKEKSNKG